MPTIFNQRVVAGLHAYAWLAGLASLLLGSLVLAGWNAGVPGLAAVHTGWATVSPATALAFILAGLSSTFHKANRHKIGAALAAMFGALSAGVLAGYAIAGADVLNPVLGNRLTTHTGVLVGTMAPATAACLLLLGLCLLIIGRTDGPSRRALTIACAAGMVVSGLALLCYAYGVDGMYAVAFYRAMALQTAATLFVLFSACFVHDPEKGFAAIIASGMPSGGPTRGQLLLSTFIPFLIGLVVLRGLHVAPSLGIAIVVAGTIVPMVGRIIVDGRTLDRLEMQRQLAVEAQAELTAALEDRVLERSAALAASEARLRQSQKMEAIGQLTGGLAHDFNNMLAGIGGSLELIGRRLAQGRADETGRYILAANESLRRAAALTQRLLAFSRRQVLDPAPTDINRLVSGMEELIRGTIGPNISLQVAASPGLWASRLDASQLENALLNLCINARDAMPQGGVIRVQTSNALLGTQDASALDLPPGEYVSLSVADTGAGMPPDVIEHAFDPFFTTKPIGAGTGLGLSMVHGFVKQSGGQVAIHSAPGEGTTVSLHLPRYHGPADVVGGFPAAGPAPLADADETVLIVDDEPAVRMLMSDVLGEFGYRILEAADGPAGLQALRSKDRIDLLITDVGLPGGLNGRQLADAARMSRPHLKVLFVTGFADTSVLRQGDLGDGMHVLVKPFAMEALPGRVRALIDGGAVRPSAV